MAGIIPGIILTILFIAAIFIWSHLKPEIAPPGDKKHISERIRSLSGLIEPIILFLIIIIGLFLGIFTPTEAGAIAAFSTTALAFARRNIDFKGFFQALFETARISCMILVIVAGATVFGHFLAVTQIPFSIANWITSLNLPSSIVMAMIIVVYLVGGCFIDALALIMLTVPIFYPVVISLGFDPVWFGVIIVLVTQIGVITPPVGINVYVVSGIVKDVPLHTIFKGVVPLLIALIVGTILLIPFPQIALFLPNLMK